MLIMVWFIVLKANVFYFYFRAYQANPVGLSYVVMSSPSISQMKASLVNHFPPFEPPFPESVRTRIKTIMIII